MKPGKKSTHSGQKEHLSRTMSTMPATAHEVGRFVTETADGDHIDHGKYVVIWKRIEGEWKLHRDIFNSNMAAQ